MSRAPSNPCLAILLGVITGLLAPIPATAAEITFVHPDHLGSPVAYTDVDGNVIGREYYTPYGESLNPPTTDDTVSYTGHYRDGDTGLVYMQARYYDPEIGRFLSTDPVTFSPDKPQQFNRYWYANGNPYAYTDPDGNVAVAAVGLVVLGALIVGAAVQKYNTDPAAKAAVDEVANVIVSGTAKVMSGTVAGEALGAMLNESSGEQQSDGTKGESNPAGECQSCGGETADSTGKIAAETGLSPREVKDKIHGVKAGQLGSGGKKNPDVEVCTNCGETYPKTDDGGIGDSIGNIHDIK